MLKYIILFSPFMLFSQNEVKKDSIKITELKEIVVVAKKKAIEQKADRTIFDFSEQAHLNSGSLLVFRNIPVSVPAS